MTHEPLRFLNRDAGSSQSAPDLPGFGVINAVSPESFEPIRCQVGIAFESLAHFACHRRLSAPIAARSGDHCAGPNAHGTHWIRPSRTRKWLPHLSDGIQRGGFNVAPHFVSESVQWGRRVIFRFTSIRFPQRQGHSRTTHFGLTSPTTKTSAPRRSGRSFMLATCLIPRRRRRRIHRHILRRDAFDITLLAMKCPEVGACLRASKMLAARSNSRRWGLAVSAN